MTIDEAIERLETFVERHTSAGYSDLIPAIKLSIKALKRCRTLAQESKLWALDPLPGET